MRQMDRRRFLGRLAAGTTAWATAGVVSSPWGTAPNRDGSHVKPLDQAVGRQSQLRQPAFKPLPLGSITPGGWLARQLHIQADGLSGHLDEFWPDVGQSQWFGGQAEGWERAPYWLDGVIPLAWSLGDERLKSKVAGYVETIVQGQRSDGWYAPYPADASTSRYDLWAILLANKMLAQYHDAAGDDSVFRAVEASLRAMAAGLDRTPLYNWGRFRWFEGLIPVFYVYERTGEGWLLDLAHRLKEQGFDYDEFYRGGEVTSPTPRRGLWTWGKHVVNTGMAIKAGALAWRLEGRDEQRTAASRMIALLDRYHGQASGMFTGDECLAGKNPVQGSELCAVVEFLYSLEIATSTLGDADLADRLERVAFNALPATFKPDMWAHQYDQQANQVQCTLNPDHMWTTNGPESNFYGLEPNYGCCTSNMHQGWPKFTAHLWMETPDAGLAAVAYAPSEARFTSRGVPVAVALDSDYPFRENLSFTVTTERAVSFPLLLRVPNWAENAVMHVEGEGERALTSGAFHRVEREWHGTTQLSLSLPMRPRVTLRYNEAASVERGPLVYALQIEEDWTRINEDEPGRELPHGDFEVRPASPWNYGILLPEPDMAAALAFEERPVGDRPFSPEGAGMAARVTGRLLPDWKLEHGWAREIAPGLHESTEPLEQLSLIPYGCTNIRVTEFPRLAG